MKKFLKIALLSSMVLALGATTASADAAKGQKIYKKKLKAACGFNGAKFTATHTQDEWDAIGEAGMAAEIKKQCPNAPEVPAKFMKDLYEFGHDFASDSGNVPAC
jgi:hypothetical protein